MTVLNWCLLALEYSLKNENERSTQALIQCTCAYANSKFVRALLYIHEHIGSGLCCNDFFILSVIHFSDLLASSNFFPLPYLFSVGY